MNNDVVCKPTIHELFSQLEGVAKPYLLNVSYNKQMSLLINKNYFLQKCILDIFLNNIFFVEMFFLESK